MKSSTLPTERRSDRSFCETFELASSAKNITRQLNHKLTEKRYIETQIP